MAFGTYQDTTWPVDTEEVEWRLRHAKQHVTDGDKNLAASVMGAYRHLTDPFVPEKDAIEALKRARVVVDEIKSGIIESLEEESAKRWVVEFGDHNVIGPYTHKEAEAKAKEFSGRVVGLKWL